MFSKFLTRVQGKTLVSNSISFSDITCRCGLYAVPVTNTTSNINSNERSYSSLSCSDTTSIFFLSTISQINTSCNVKSTDKSYSSSYSKVSSKPIAKNAKYPSFKTEIPLPLEDLALFDGPVDSSCFYKSKYDVARYRDRAPHISYGEKVDLIKNVFVSEKIFGFP